MKLGAIFRFEFAYQARRVWPWLVCAALGLVSFLMTRDSALVDALYEDFFVNSPFNVASTTVFGSLMWLMLAGFVGGEAGARDMTTRMYPLTYSAPLRKVDYLGGRFLAALALNALLLLAVQAGILLAVYSPAVHPEVIGPFRPAAHLTAYAIISLPNAFAATALQFWLATRSGRPMAAYAASLLLFFIAFFIASVVLYYRGLGALLDPIGIRFIIEDVAHEWTTTEKNWRLLGLEGVVLRNRLLWVGVGLGALALTFLRFRFAHRAESVRWRRRKGGRHAQPVAPSPSDIAASAPVSVPRVPRAFGFAAEVRRMVAIARDSFRTVARSWPGFGLLGVIPLLTVLVLIDQTGGQIPTTALVLPELTAPLSAELSRWVIVPLLIIYFAGELVWRERDAGVAETIDAIPGSDWAPLLGKLLGLGLALALFMALLAAAGMGAQTALGHHDFEIGLYLTVLFGLQLPEYLLFGVLALAVHVLVARKYAGHLVASIAWVFIAVPTLFGVEHGLLVYGAGPAWSYTEMRGFGGSLGPWLWFKVYWAAWALLLAVLARLLWVRGLESDLRVRLRLARRRLTRSTARTGAAAAGLVLVLGGFLFYEADVVGEYRTVSEVAEMRAQYERRYGRYAGIAQPHPAAARLHIEIYPERQSAHIRGTYRLVNRSAVPIDSIHLATVPGVETRGVEFDRAAAPVLTDEERGYRIYSLEMSLQPGDSIRLQFQVRIDSPGLPGRGLGASVVSNGTYFTNGDWLPAIGYQRSRELTTASDRRDHGLAPRPVVPSLYDGEAREGRSGGTALEAVVGTAADQIAVAPGALHRTWTTDGRRYFHYASDGPIGGEWAFLSADYAVREGRWDAPDGSHPPVAIRIFHHPEHTANLDRLLRSIRASLDYYTSEFGPYPYSHISFAERPGNGTGMSAERSMITFSEGTALWNPDADPGSVDLPFAVAAHEMAHQWTVPYAFVEGAPVMSESLAWYYGMKAVEHARGPEQLQRLLSFMRRPNPYRPIRRGEPLLRGLDPYLSYRKGPFALYALSEYMGEERVNLALRRIVEKHRQPGAPLATTLDLYHELQVVTPDSLQYLLHDLFEVNTVWRFEAGEVAAEQTDAGAWRVTFDVRARKVVTDSTGVDTEVPMDEWVEIGVFAPVEEGAGRLSEPLYLQRHRIRSGEQTITVTVPREPVGVGIDPYHVLDWEEGEDDDNLELVETDD